MSIFFIGSLAGKKGNRVMKTAGKKNILSIKNVND